jgi:hypothetical protein
MSNIKTHTSKDAIWVNAAGDAVPVKFVPKSDKVKEALAAKVHKAAIGVETALAAFHTILSASFAEVQAAVNEEFEIKKGNKKKPGKGSFTWYNFDKSLKVEADINEIAKWDAALMTEAYAHFSDYINTNLTEANVLIAALVNNAFGNNKGQIDSKKVFQLLKHQHNIKHSKFQKACELIKQAQGIDYTKLYMRVWEKLPTGEYRNINLNFSSL